LFWKWKSRSRTPAKDDISPEVKQLIRRTADANVTRGAPRIHGELLKLGIDISERSVSRFMPKSERKPPSQTWRTFLDNHLGSLASIGLFTVPTATFRVLFVFLVLVHDRRRVVHFNVTGYPTTRTSAELPDQRPHRSSSSATQSRSVPHTICRSICFDQVCVLGLVVRGNDFRTAE
jgi:hypothetical protein